MSVAHYAGYINAACSKQALFEMSRTEEYANITRTTAVASRKTLVISGMLAMCGIMWASMLLPEIVEATIVASAILAFFISYACKIAQWVRYESTEALGFELAFFGFIAAGTMEAGAFYAFNDFPLTVATFGIIIACTLLFLLTCIHMALFVLLPRKAPTEQADREMAPLRQV